AFVVATAGPAAADTIEVTNGDDSGSGSLRAAIATAESTSGPDTIAIQAQVVTITIDSPLEINAPDAVTITSSGTTLDANGQPSGLVMTSGADFAVLGLTITGVSPGDLGSDHAAVGTLGGGNLSLGNCTLTGNNVAGDNAGVAF